MMAGAPKESFPSEPLITLQYETFLYFCHHPLPSSMALRVPMDEFKNLKFDRSCLRQKATSTLVDVNGIFLF